MLLKNLILHKLAFVGIPEGAWFSLDSLDSLRRGETLRESFAVKCLLFFFFFL